MEEKGVEMPINITDFAVIRKNQYSYGKKQF